MRGATRFVMFQYFSFQVDGREHVPRSGPVVIVPNHVTNLDYCFVGFASPRWVHWIGLAEAMRNPLLGWLGRLAAGIPIERTRLGALPALRAARDVLREERVLGVFFEGHRTKNRLELDTPKRGAAWLALRAGAPVVPVTLAGLQRIWPRDGWPRPGSASLRFHPPIATRDFAPELPLRERARLLTERIGEVILSAVPPDGSHRMPPP